MTPAEIDQLLALGSESRSVEFKQAGAWTDTHFRGKLTRAVLSLANTRDGGVVIVGMKEDLLYPGRHVPDPLSEQQRLSFHPDTVVPQVNSHAAPYISFSVVHHSLQNGTNIVVFAVDEFKDYPVVCIKDVAGSDPQKPLVRRGAIVVRSGRTAETTEILSFDDLRELIELAVDKGLETYFRRQRIERRAQGGNHEQLFRDQLGDLAE